jgi:hypothetical protein
MPAKAKAIKESTTRSATSRVTISSNPKIQLEMGCVDRRAANLAHTSKSSLLIPDSVTGDAIRSRPERALRP